MIFYGRIEVEAPLLCFPEPHGFKKWNRRPATIGRDLKSLSQGQKNYLQMYLSAESGDPDSILKVERRREIMRNL